MHRDVLDVMTENSRAAGGRKNQTHEKLERGRLARAVRAEKTEDLTVIDRERQSIERAHFAFAEETDFVVFRQVVNFDNWHGLFRGNLRFGIQIYFAPAQYVRRSARIEWRARRVHGDTQRTKNQLDFLPRTRTLSRACLVRSQRLSQTIAPVQ